MFQKTLKKLTVLNSGVFLLIFILFGYLVYGYVAHQLFSDVDDALRYKVEAAHLVNGQLRLITDQPWLLDPQIFLFLRDSNGNGIPYHPSSLADLNEIQTFITQMKEHPLKIKKINEHLYRILAVPFNDEQQVLLRPDGSEAKIVQVIGLASIDSEAAMLKKLLNTLVVTLILGVLAIASAGYFLAKRALVPIKASWDKQQQFVADASHELRTPLAVIKSNTELLLRHPEHTIEQESVRVTNVLREAMRMKKLVVTLLTLARADASQLELQKITFNIGEVIADVIEQFIPLAEVRGVQLKFSVDDVSEIEADKERLLQLFAILLDNALKYTSNEGTILVNCYQNASLVVIRIEDNGCGIAPEDLPHVFDRFFRGDKARSRESGGAGLGLAIADWIVKQHGGKIQIESELGLGTKIEVSLPVKSV
jgi:two-component system, OmpR family, sensor histidine kinase CiaH